MNFQIVSDLHIDTKEHQNYQNLIIPVADILILNGDIGSLYKPKQFFKFLSYVCSNFKIVLFIFGNHEFYCHKSTNMKEMHQLKKVIYNISKKLTNLHILDRSSVIFNDVCVVGCTLWSKFNGQLPKYIIKIPDMTTSQYNYLHKQDLKYINHMIDYCKINKKKLLVITHYPPLPNLSKISNKNHKHKELYQNNLNYLLSSEFIHTWVYGHVHNNCDFITSQGTRVVGNQLGKIKDQIIDFCKNKVIKI